MNPNWKTILFRAWSMHGVYVMLFLTALQMALTQFEAEIPPMAFSLSMLTIGFLIGLGRLLNQGLDTYSSLRKFRSDDSGAVSRRGVATGLTAALVISLATPFIAKWEGVRLTAYKDIVGVDTICFGDTHGVKPGDTATMEECVVRLEEDVEHFYSEISACMTNPNIPAGVQASMLELAFNVGSPKVCRSTMMRKANAGHFRSACDELRRWVMAGGKRIRGLSNRRADSKHSLCLRDLPRGT